MANTPAEYLSPQKNNPVTQQEPTDRQNNNPPQYTPVQEQFEKNHKRSPLLLIAIIMAVITIGLLFFYFINRSSSQTDQSLEVSSPTPENKISPTDSTVQPDEQTVTIGSAGIKVSLPRVWQKMSGDDTALYYKENPKSFFDVITRNLEGDTLLDELNNKDITTRASQSEFMERMKTVYTEEVTRQKELISIEDTVLYDSPAIYVTSQSNNLKSRDVLLIRDRTLYIIGFRAAPDQFDSEWSEFQEILSSITFL